MVTMSGRMLLSGGTSGDGKSLAQAEFSEHFPKSALAAGDSTSEGSPSSSRGDSDGREGE